MNKEITLEKHQVNSFTNLLRIIDSTNAKSKKRTYSASHFVARNRKEKEVSSTRIVGDESALSDVLEEVSFAGVFSGEFPRRVKIRFRISVGIHEHLELLLHLLVV